MVSKLGEVNNNKSVWVHGYFGGRVHGKRQSAHGRGNGVRTTFPDVLLRADVFRRGWTRWRIGASMKSWSMITGHTHTTPRSEASEKRYGRWPACGDDGGHTERGNTRSGGRNYGSLRRSASPVHQTRCFARDKLGPGDRSDTPNDLPPFTCSVTSTHFIILACVCLLFPSARLPVPRHSFMSGEPPTLPPAANHARLLAALRPVLLPPCIILFVPVRLRFSGWSGR